MSGWGSTFNSEAKGMLLDIIESQRKIIKINFLEMDQKEEKLKKKKKKNNRHRKKWEGY